MRYASIYFGVLVLAVLLNCNTAFCQITPFNWWKIDRVKGHKEIGSIVQIDSNYNFHFVSNGNFFSQVGDSLNTGSKIDSVALIPTADTTISEFYFYTQSRSFGPFPVTVREVTTYIFSSGDTLYYRNEKGVLYSYVPSSTGSGTVDWSQILNMPPGFADDIDHVDDADNDPLNEIQTISINGNLITLSNGGGQIILEYFSGDWNDLINVPATFPPSPHTHTEADIIDLDHYTDADIDGSEPAFNGWDKNELNDFSGNFTELNFTGTTGFSDLIDNVDDADSDPTNELYNDQELRDSISALRADLATLQFTVDTCCNTTMPPPSALFQPTDIANLGLWIDGSDIDGDGVQEGTGEQFLSGTLITNLKDKSGFNRHFTYSSGTPQHQLISGSLYSIAFDGDDNFVSDHIASEYTWWHSDDVTVFIRFEANSVTFGDLWYLISNAYNVTRIGMGLYFSDHSTILHGIGGFNYNGQGSASGRFLYHTIGGASFITQANTFYNCMWVVDHDAASSGGRLTGEVDGVTAPLVLNSSNGLSTTSAPHDTMKIGSNGTANGGWMNGSIAELIVYARQLTTTEIDQIKNYLTTKYQ